MQAWTITTKSLLLVDLTDLCNEVGGNQTSKWVLVMIILSSVAQWAVYGVRVLKFLAEFPSDCLHVTQFYYVVGPGNQAGAAPDDDANV